MATRNHTMTGAPTGGVTPEVVFLFPGQGAQAPGMARGLFEAEPVFRETLTECSRRFEPHIGVSLAELLYPPDDAVNAASAETLKATRLAQPAMLAVEIALARFWESQGLTPSAMMGHSLGDFAAAHLSGVFTLSGVVSAIAARSRLMQDCEPGAMLAVLQPRDAVAELISTEAGISLAGVNGPRNCVVAGSMEELEAFAASCAGQGMETRRLQTSHAFHTERMRPAVDAFRAHLSELQLAAPGIPMVSSRTGTWLTAEEARDPGFWALQIVDPVLFHDGLVTLGARPGRVFLEVGPGTTLSSLARQSGLGKTGVILSSLGHANDSRPDREMIADAVNRLQHAGVLAGNSNQPADDAPVSSNGSQPSTPLDRTMSTSQTQPPSRLSRIRAALAEVFEEYSGLDVGAESADSTFLEMGFDSLFLTQVATALQNEFGVPIKFRRMLEDLSTLDRLAAHFDEVLPPDQFAAPAESPAVGTPAVDTAPAAPDSLLQWVVQEQLAIMRQQLELLGGSSDPSGELPADFPRLHSAAPTPQQPGGASASAADVSAPGEKPAETGEPQAFGAQARITTRVGDEFTSDQRACFDAFLERYEAKTGKSKAFTETHRSVMADPRVVTGFQPLLKELVYPIVVERSSGSHLWDVMFFFLNFLISFHTQSLAVSRPLNAQRT